MENSVKMEDTRLNEILASYRDAINALIERVDSQDEMIKALMEKSDDLNRLVFDEVLTPAKQALDEQIYNAGLADFTEKYGSPLEGYNEKLRPIEGEDFDVMKQAYDGYNAIEGDKPEANVFVDELKKVIDEQLNSIREAIGAPADAEVTVTQDGKTGETTVEVDGKEQELETEETISEDMEEETDPEEMAAYEKELEKMLK